MMIWHNKRYETTFNERKLSNAETESMERTLTECILYFYMCLHNCEKQLLAFSCPSVHPHETT